MDLLVKLYALPVFDPGVAGLQLGIIRKPIGPEHDALTAWVAAHFGARWSSEAAVALANRPVTLLLAAQAGKPLGFCCYDATARGLVGPIGVVESARRAGLGASLLRACLDDMRLAGYGYAIVGGVAGAERFFERVAGAVEIPGSTPGLYADLLSETQATS